MKRRRISPCSSDDQLLFLRNNWQKEKNDLKKKIKELQRDLANLAGRFVELSSTNVQIRDKMNVSQYEKTLLKLANRLLEAENKRLISKFTEEEQNKEQKSNESIPSEKSILNKSSQEAVTSTKVVAVPKNCCRVTGCKFNNIGFNNEKNARRHERQQHGSYDEASGKWCIRKYECKARHKMFLSTSNYKNHQISKHPKEKKNNSAEFLVPVPKPEFLKFLT